jgi:two-component system, sensor histidine kinase PdtaS
MHGRRLDDLPSRQALEECESRVQTIALVHEQLYQSKDLARVPLSEYARTLAENVFSSAGASPGMINLKVEIEDLYLAVGRAIPCGLILNELITNALKHAFPEGRAGVVRVELRRTASGRFVLLVSDDGVGLPPSVDVRQTDSLGLQLVRTLADQLRGELRVERGAGTAFRLEFDGDA